MRRWSTVLNEWNKNYVFKYPKYLKKSFQWNVSPLVADRDALYVESFMEDDELPTEQDSSSFDMYLNKVDKTVDSIAFYNFKYDTILVVPTKKRGRNYATLKGFVDNAPLKQQQELWKLVRKCSIDLLKTNKKVWISTHGHGVPYLHVRIAKYPKHYFDENLKKMS